MPSNDDQAPLLDPLTGEPMTVTPPIRVVTDKCVDATGREVTLDERGNWRYVE